MPDSTLVSVRLSNDLRDQVDEVARLSKRSRSFIVKEAVETYLDERQAYLAAVDEALAEAERGIFVSSNAVDEWLRSWGTDNVLPMPEPEDGAERGR